jgi:hypothetical protein
MVFPQSVEATANSASRRVVGARWSGNRGTLLNVVSQTFQN